MPHVRILNVAFLVSCLLLTACLPVTPAPGSSTARTPADSLAVDASQPITQEETMTADNPMADPLVKAAVADLAQQTGAPPSEITLVSYESVTWPDGSLGCPQPDLLYPQVLVDGARIRLQVGDQSYEYHSGGGESPFLCENPTEPVPGSIFSLYP